MGWDIGALLLRLSELNQTSACIPYLVERPSAFMMLELPRKPPTIAYCRKVINYFAVLLDHWGYKEIGFDFGVGSDLDEPSGAFAIGHGRPPGSLLVS